MGQGPGPPGDGAPESGVNWSPVTRRSQCLLHHVFRGGPVAEHDDSEADQAERVRLVQVGDGPLRVTAPRVPVLRAPGPCAGQPGLPRAAATGKRAA